MMNKAGFFRRIIERFGKGLGLIFVLIGVPVIVVGLILLLIPLIGWIAAIPVLVLGVIITLIGVTIAAKTSTSKHIHIHPHHKYYYEAEKEKQEDEEVEVKGSLVCYRCGAYISERDTICRECGARQ